ncbi:MAG: TIGR03545 family protein, partial [Bdellovibrionales bacterium]|nr:TIGR03545 family protein [Bdellovibrionales bacterium]
MNADNKKKSKKKGPIRFEAVIPFLIICALFYVYFSLFFDSNIRSASEWIGTRVNGAEVNVAKVKSSFWNAYLHIYGVQVTDKEKPEQNIIEIGSIKFDLLWDALLRAKFVVETSNIEDIKLMSKREHPGHVLPPSDESSQAKSKLEKGVLDQAEKDFNKNVLGDVASVLGGTEQGQQIAKINETLSSEKKIKELQEELKKKEAVWQERLKKLPNQKELDGLVNKAKSLKFDSNNPQQFANDLQALQKILQEADQKIKLVQQTNSDLQSDIKKTENDIKQIDQWVKQDIAELQKRMKIPSIDVKSFTMGLFGQMFAEKLAKARPYIAMAKEYMPPAKSEKQKEQDNEDQLVPKKRSAGMNFEFPKKKSYPLVWIKKAVISSKSDNSSFSGDLEGVITDITSNPVHLGKPTIATLKGGFPNQEISGIDAKLILDHTTDHPVDTLTGKVSSYPMNSLSLAQGDSVNFEIEKAKGASNFSGILKDKVLNVRVNSSFNQVKYNVQAQNKDLDEILKDTVKRIPLITLNTTARGGWNDIAWGFDSNLGSELSNGIKRNIQARI